MINKLFLTLCFLLSFISSFEQVHVSGYYRKNGTYVEPHMRSNPDGNPYNNWSYPGNSNPYTGKIATGNPETYLNNYYNNNTTNYTNPTYNSKIHTSGTTKNDTYSNNANYNMNINIVDLTSNSRVRFISTEKINLRVGPTIYSSAMGQIVFNSTVYIVERFDDNWTKVMYEIPGGNSVESYVIGYVNSRYLSNEFNQHDNSNILQNAMSGPESLVRSFLTDLGNKNFYAAYLKTQNPIWNSYEWFSSTTAYGGIDGVIIYETKLENQYNDEAIIYANYYASDSYNNKYDTYKQIFIVRRIQGEWKITRVKLVNK